MNSKLQILLLLAALGADRAEQGPTEAARTDSLDLRYGLAQVQLAEANLQRLEQINRRLPRSVPASVVASYRDEVEVAKTELQQAKDAATSDFAVWLRRAETTWKAADTTWKNGLAVNQRSRDTFEPLDIQRFYLRAQLQRLQFERGQALASAPRDAQLQWQLSLAQNEIQQLKEESSRSAPFGRLYPTWWW